MQVATAQSLDVAWLGEVQVPHDVVVSEHRLGPLLMDAQGASIETIQAWEAQRSRILERWKKFLGVLPKSTELPKIEVLHEERISGVLRQLIRYPVESGQLVEAYVLRPIANPDQQKLPGVVVFHSTVNDSILQPAGVNETSEKAFGLKLAQRGYVAICPRNYLWPDNFHIAAQEQADAFHHRYPQHKGMARMVSDAMVAVDLLLAQNDVDSGRIGAVGHSLGAKEVLYLGAFDPRVQVIVSSEGGIGIEQSNWDADWYLGPEVKQADFDLAHHQLLAAIAPRAFLLLGGDSADGDGSTPYLQFAEPVYRLYTDQPRLGFFNHHEGHTIPPKAEERIYDWLDTFLGVKRR